MNKSKIQRVLIAVRPRAHRLPVADSLARFLADALGAEIALMSCVAESPLASGLAWTGPAPLIAQQSGPFDSEQEQLAQLEQLERLAQPLRDAGVTVTSRVSSLRPVYQGLLDEAENWQADLLIVGVHEPRLVPHTRLTDIDRQLIRLCPCPLLVARDPTIESYRAILAAVDPLSRHSEPAGLDRAILQAAGDLSRAFNARFCITSVYPDPENFEVVSSVEVEPGIFYGTENMEAAHRKALTDLIRERDVGPSQTILRPGDPRTVIAKVASEHKIDLIVLGSVKRGRLQSAILGSTAETLVADAACDVLLVKPPPS